MMDRSLEASAKAELIPFYTFAGYLTPIEAALLKGGQGLKEYRARARINRKCENCENPVWRYGVGELCFPCCTGETDASEDYELVYQP